MTKQIWKLSLAAILAFSMVGCGDDDGNDDANQPGNTTKPGDTTKPEDTDKPGTTPGESGSDSATACFTKGSMKCSTTNTAILTCDGSKWQITDSCPNGCKDGKCLEKTDEPSTPGATGDSCDPTTYVDRCEGNAVIYCGKDKKLGKEECGALTCFTERKSKVAWCGSAETGAKACQAEGQTFFLGNAAGENAFCSYIKEYGASYYGVCLKDEKGTMYGVETLGDSICAPQDGKDYAVFCDATGNIVGVPCEKCENYADGAVCDDTLVGLTGPGSAGTGCLPDNSDCAAGHGEIVELPITYSACSAAEAATCTAEGTVCVKSTLQGETEVECMPECTTVGQAAGMCYESEDKALYYGLECKQVGNVKAFVLANGSMCNGGSSTSVGYCPEYDSDCSDLSPNAVAVCDYTAQSFYCYETCSKVNETRSVCNTLYTDAAHTTTADFSSQEKCTEFSGKSIWIDTATSDADYVKCATSCNEAHTACK